MDENSYLEIRDKFVVKSNDLIQRSRFKLNLQQQKAILFIVSQIKTTDEDFTPYTFEIRDFCKVCGIDSIGGNNYETLKAALKELSDKSLYIMVDRNTEKLVRWLDDVTFYKDRGLVSVTIGKAMKPYLLHLHENFTKYELVYTLRMKHSTTPRLYELLKSYHYNDLKPYTVTLDLEELRKLIDAEKKTYQEYKYFKRYIIDKSVDEINSQTDIVVSVNPLKKKRIVYALEFHIERQKTADILANIAETDKVFLKEVATAAQPERETIQIAACSVKEAKPKIKPAEKPFAVKKEAAEQLPIPMDKPKRESKGKRYQVRIFARGTKTLLKTFSKYSVEEVVSAANEWLHSNGYPQIDKFTGSSLRWEV